ncbi:MAG: LamG domain-containing protein, partial [Mesorhizobium sp.]
PQMSLDSWHAIAVDKDSSGKIRLYVDGSVFASATPADSTIFNSTGALEIGRALATAVYDGWIDELRITKGVARYASDSGYTPATSAFPRA